MEDIRIPGWLKSCTDESPTPADLYRLDPAQLDRPVYIYALLDPETKEPRYIGKSIRPNERLQNHINEKPSNCHRSHWIQSLKNRGLLPEMIILESFMGEWPWQEGERFWIRTLRERGYNLVNNTEGGDGVVGLPAEARERMRRTWLGRKHKPESIKKMGSARLGRKSSDETKAKHSRAMKGRRILWTDSIAHANRKIPEALIPIIEARLANGELVKDLADEYGVVRTTISKIKAGKYFDQTRYGD